MLEVAVSRVGLFKGAKVIGFMWGWSVLELELGREPTVEEYGERWLLSRATAYRERVRFRAAFPGEESPSRLLAAASEYVAAARAERNDRKRALVLGMAPAT
jgi:hypothetical protein